MSSCPDTPASAPHGPDGSPRMDGSPRIYPMRLQKFLARAGVASRRRSEDLMTAGRVRVNGTVVRELGSKVDPQTDVVEVDGMAVSIDAGPVTIALNKPLDCVTTMDDPQGRFCVAQLVPTQRYPGLYPIGRLDRDTTGLLLFSTDGELGNGLLHPSHHVDKTYRATVKGLPGPAAIARLAGGVDLDGRMTAPAAATVLSHDTDTSVVEIVIHEGRKRQVRRMFDAVGHPVIALERTSFGPIALGDLPRGAYRFLTEDELSLLNGALGKSC